MSQMLCLLFHINAISDIITLLFVVVYAIVVAVLPLLFSHLSFHMYAIVFSVSYQLGVNKEIKFKENWESV